MTAGISGTDESIPFQYSVERTTEGGPGHPAFERAPQRGRDRSSRQPTSEPVPSTFNPQAAIRLAFDRDFSRFGVFGFGHDYFQHTVLELGHGLVFIDRRGQYNRASEAA